MRLRLGFWAFWWERMESWADVKVLKLSVSHTCRIGEASCGVGGGTVLILAACGVSEGTAPHPPHLLVS